MPFSYPFSSSWSRKKNRIPYRHVRNQTHAKTAASACLVGLSVLAFVQMGIRAHSAQNPGMGAVLRPISERIRHRRAQRWVVTCHNCSRILKRLSVFLLTQLPLWLSSARMMSPARLRTSLYLSMMLPTTRTTAATPVGLSPLNRPKNCPLIPSNLHQRLIRSWTSTDEHLLLEPQLPR